MRLINVEAFLDFHEGKARPDAQILKEFNDSELAGTAYAALSHCWGKLEDEVQYTEMESLTNVDVATRGKIQRRSGYRKIRKACQQARRDDLHWLWVDTCCIDKRSSAELSEAINSMYVWYANSDGCFAFLHDVDAKTLPTEPDNRNFSESNGWPRWFSRGWTLQELIAPQDVHFFNQNWEYITRKRDSVDTLSVITRIATGVLKDGLEWSHASVAQIMSWAADRTTTRGEDRAYSLLGLLRVHMPMLYGEGKSAAFLRLQLEIIKTNNDQSIFAWGWKIKNKSASRFLADDPSYFRDCSNIHRITHVDFLNILEEYISKSRLHALLSTEKRLQTFAVTNHGIQIWLPLTRQSRTGPSELFSAMLACCEARGTKSRSSPITIAIEQFDHRSRSRCLGWPQVENQILPVKFKKILLPYRDNVNPTIRGPLKKQSTARFAFEDIIRSDSLIVVVGAAGSGKSNFIKKLTGTVPTTTVSAFTSVHKDKRFVFVDTPPLDESGLGVIVRQIGLLRRRSVRLAGVIYTFSLHSEWTKKDRRHFQSILDMCGKESIDRLRLVSTMWDVVDPVYGTRVYNKLENQVSKALEAGARSGKFYNTPASAWAIVESFGDAPSLRKGVVDGSNVTRNTNVSERRRVANLLAM